MTFNDNFYPNNNFCSNNNFYPSNDFYSLIKSYSKELGIDFISISAISSYNEVYKKIYKENQSDIETIFPKAKTIISSILYYDYFWNNLDYKSVGYIAPYTVANFYKTLSKKLQILGRFIIKQYKMTNKNYRVFVNSRIDDKLVAFSTRLGYYGYNSAIIGGFGQKGVLGNIIFDFDIDCEKAKCSDSFSLCKDCDICINSCPTKAITDKGKVKKEYCLHHLSSSLEWEKKINGVDIIDIWGKRFFGCNRCVEVCPKNRKDLKIGLQKDLFGYVGSSFDFNNIFMFQKSNYKSYFRGNQLSASWIPVVSLVRNSLIALFNQSRADLVKEYIKNMDKFGFESYEVEYIKRIYKLLL